LKIGRGLKQIEDEEDGEENEKEEEDDSPSCLQRSQEQGMDN